MEGPWERAWTMGAPASPATWVPVEYVTSTASMYKNYAQPTPPVTMGRDSSNPYPYVHVTKVPGKRSCETLRKVLECYGKKIEDTTRKAGVAAGNVWYHLKTNPSVTDAAMARLTQRTKVIAEGGHDKVFQRTFGVLPGEHLKNEYACYLSTSSGPVIGTLYISTERVAFCSDSPLCHNIGPGQQEWIYYKVVVPLGQLKAVHPSSNTSRSAEKYIQIITADNHEFWFMGFVSYDKALKNLMEALNH